MSNKVSRMSIELPSTALEFDVFQAVVITPSWPESAWTEPLQHFNRSTGCSVAIVKGEFASDSN